MSSVWAPATSDAVKTVDLPRFSACFESLSIWAPVALDTARRPESFCSKFADAETVSCSPLMIPKPAPRPTPRASAFLLKIPIALEAPASPATAPAELITILP